jgi:hypothetical protein
MNVMMNRITCFLLLALLVVSCRSGQEKNGFGEVSDSVLNEGLDISKQATSDIIENIASPVEIAALLKRVGAPFSQKNLSDPDIIEQFSTANQQAFNLGVYGTDLGYLNMYNKSGSTINYLTSIKKLADNIKVGQFFDFTTLKRLAQNSQNLDSLMYISVHSFNLMDDYLRQNRRSNLSALIIAGAWMEGFYLATSTYLDKPHPDLAERIGEQKIILSELMLILKNYERDPYVANVIKNLDELKILFNDVKISKVPGEPEMIEENGMLVIKQNEKSVVETSPELLRNIIATSEKVRKSLINL